MSNIIQLIYVKEFQCGTFVEQVASKVIKGQEKSVKKCEVQNMRWAAE